jgi:hypothetical protein
MTWRINVTFESICGERATLFVVGETPHAPAIGDTIRFDGEFNAEIYRREWLFLDRQLDLDCWCKPVLGIDRVALVNLIVAGLHLGWSSYDLSPDLKAELVRTIP